MIIHIITLQVGACIADKKTYQIVGIGYNSMPYVKEGDNDKCTEFGKWVKDKNHYGKLIKHQPIIAIIALFFIVVHAAVNAIINKTRESIEGCTIYLTLFPDKDCAHAIIEAGITEVVYCMYTRYGDREKRHDMVEAKSILQANPVTYMYMHM